MSDLQCPVRFHLARHAEAEYETVELYDAGGSLTVAGRRQAADLARRLTESRIAAVWTSPMARAVQTAEIVAARLGTLVVVREGLREFGVGDHAGQPPEPDPFVETFGRWMQGELAARVDGGESGREVVDRVQQVLDEIADTYRGEAVLVVGHGGALCVSIATLTGRRPPEGYRLAPTGVVRVDRDGDGWLLAESWDSVPQEEAAAGV